MIICYAVKRAGLEMSKSTLEREFIRDGRAPIPEKEITSKIMSKIRGKNTKPEITLRKALWHNGLRGYRLHWSKVPGRPDIAFPGKKIAIFVHGCYWHRCPLCKPPMPKTHVDFWKNKFDRNIKRDEQKKQALEELGWRVLIVWECQIKKSLESTVQHVQKIYRERS